MNRSVSLSVTLLALSLTAAGCGDSGGDPQTDVGDTDVDTGDTSTDDSADVADEGSAELDAADDAVEDAETTPPEVPLNGGVEYNPPECATYAAKGPYEVGITTLSLTEGERTVEVEVFYPTSAEAVAGATRFAYDMRVWLPVADQGKIPDEAAPLYGLDAYRDVEAGTDGPYPLVVFSHGLAGYRLQSGTLLAHLASWGYVVASADHPERGLARIVETLIPGTDQSPATVRAMIELLRAENDGDTVLGGQINFESVAMTGHSAGGGTTFAVAGDEVFDAFISYAAGSRSGLGENPPTAAGLLIAGETDAIVPVTSIAPTFEAMATPKGYVVLAAAGHLPFSDLCAIGREQGGILQIADEYGIEVNPLLIDLGSDGCREGDMTPEVAWPIIHHLSVAWLRQSFAGEVDGDGLGADLDSCFGALFTEVDFAY
jgi:dienelactone hydrolase